MNGILFEKHLIPVLGAINKQMNNLEGHSFLYSK
jgi:hypothetical protein